MKLSKVLSIAATILLVLSLPIVHVLLGNFDNADMLYNRMTGRIPEVVQFSEDHEESFSVILDIQQGLTDIRYFIFGADSDSNEIIIDTYGLPDGELSDFHSVSNITECDFLTDAEKLAIATVLLDSGNRHSRPIYIAISPTGVRMLYATRDPSFSALSAALFLTNSEEPEENGHEIHREKICDVWYVEIIIG